MYGWACFPRAQIYFIRHTKLFVHPKGNTFFTAIPELGAQKITMNTTSLMRMDQMWIHVSPLRSLCAAADREFYSLTRKDGLDLHWNIRTRKTSSVAVCTGRTCTIAFELAPYMPVSWIFHLEAIAHRDRKCRP